jgi:hypothetical protein
MTTQSHLLDPLWASTLDEIRLNLLDRTVEISAHVRDKGSSTQYLLVCKNVSEIKYLSAPQYDWGYVEISEAEMTKNTSNTYRIRLELWAPENEMTITAEEVKLSPLPAPTGA